MNVSHGAVTTISCADASALDAAGVARARAAQAYRVPVSPAFDVRGVALRAVLGGHERLEAARRDGAEPQWEEASPEEHPALATLARGEIETFLQALAPNGTAWRDVESGRALAELLPEAYGVTRAEEAADLAVHPADLDPKGAFGRALARAPRRERHAASGCTRHEWRDGSAIVVVGAGTWHPGVHASWLPYADAWYEDEGVPARFAVLSRRGLSLRYAHPNA